MRMVVAVCIPVEKCRLGEFPDCVFASSPLLTNRFQ